MKKLMSQECQRDVVQQKYLKRLRKLSTHLFSGFVFMVLATSTAFAATRTWDGEGGDNNWSTAANWSSNTAPVSGDAVVFDATSTKDATIDIDFSIASISMNTGYSGTVTQSANFTLTGNFTRTAGTFTVSSGTTTFTGGTSSTIDTASNAITFKDVVVSKNTGGWPNNMLDLATNEVVTVTGTLSLTTGYLTGGGTLKSTNGGTMGGAFLGTWAGSTLLFQDSAGPVAFTIGSGAVVPTMNVNDANVTVTTSGTATFKALTVGAGTVDLSSLTATSFGAAYNQTGGTVSFSNASTISFATAFSLTGGTFTAKSGGTYTFTTDFTFTGGTFTNLSTLNFVANGFSQTFNVTTSVTINSLNVSLNQYAAALSLSGDTWNVGSIAFYQGGINSGTIVTSGGGSAAAGTITTGTNGGNAIISVASGTFTVADNARLPSMTVAGGTLTGFSGGTSSMQALAITSGSFTPGAGNFTATTYNQSGGTATFGSGSASFNSTFAVSAGTATLGSGSVSIAGATTLSGTGTVDASLTSSMTFSNNFTFNAAGATWTAKSGATYTFGGDFTYTAGTFTNLSGLNFYATGAPTYNVNGAITINSLTTSANHAANGITLTNDGDIWTLNGNLQVNYGSLYMSGANAALILKGNITSIAAGAWNNSNAPITFSGTANQTINVAGDTGFFNSDFTISKDYGTVTLASALVLNGTNQDLIVTDTDLVSAAPNTTTTLNLAGYALTVNGTSGTFVVNNGATLQLQGGETITTNGGYPSFASGSIAKYVGTATGGSPDYTVKNYSYSNLTIAGGNTSIFSLGANGTVSGTLTLTTGIFDLVTYNLTGSGTIDNDSGVTGNTRLRMRGGNTVTMTADTDSGLTELTGTSTYTSLSPSSFYNLTLNGSGGSWTMAANASVYGNLTITAGTLSASSYTLNVAGNWSNSGTFTASTSTVNLNGTNQTISGSSSNTFWNLKKVVTAARTLTFPTATTTTISNNFQLLGTNGNLLSLRTSSDGVQASVNINREIIQYLNVKDVKNTNASVVNCLVGCVDAGNTDNNGIATWNFTIPSSGQTKTWDFTTTSEYTKGSSTQVTGGLGNLTGSGTYGKVTPMTGFPYRKPITITNTLAVQSDYQFKITVPYDAHMKSDFGDLRFTKSNGTTPIDYWIESYSAGSSATVWVEIPDLTASNVNVGYGAGKTQIFMYYGNSSATTTSNGINTFIFFDDFNDASVSDWTAFKSNDCGTNAPGLTAPYVDSTVGNVLQISAAGVEGGAYSNTASFLDGILDAKMKLVARTGTGQDSVMMARAAFSAATPPVISSAYRFGPYWAGSAEAGIGQETGHTRHSFSSFDFGNGTWRLVSFTVSGSTLVGKIDGTQYGSIVTSGITSTGKIAVGFDACHENQTLATTQIDDVRIRKYLVTEPTLDSIGTEETFISESDASIYPSVTGTHPAYTALYAFTETLGNGNTGSVYYQISKDATNWFYYNGTAWAAAAADQSNYNTAAEVNAFLDDFVNGGVLNTGVGQFYFKAFLISDGTQPTEIDSLSLVYMPPTAVISTTSVNVTEGGTTADYDVVLSGQPTANVTIHVASSDTSNGVSLSGATLSSNDLVFNSSNWNQAQTVRVTAVNDTLYEGSHTATINFSSLSDDTTFNNMTLPSVTANITDNDAQPTISISPVSVTEGSAAVFAVTLSNPSAQTITASYTTSNGTALAGSDYTAATSSVSFLPTVTSATISIPTTDDAIDENDETFTVTLSSPTNSTLATASDTGTITDNDATPTVSWTAATQSSANENNASTMTVTAQLSAVSGLNATIPLTVSNSSTATATADYTISASPLTITAGSTTATVTITIAGDALDENDETVILNMGTATNATASGTTTHTATITDDDAAPTVHWTSAAQTSANENNNATMTVTAELSAASGLDITIPFSISGTGTATTTIDYTLSASPLTITAGSTTATATITIVGDLVDEENETVVLTIGTPTNATASGVTTHTATITDDDDSPTVTFVADKSSFSETGGVVTVTATTSAVSGRDVTVTLSPTGTATNTTDYTLSTSSIVITAGHTTGTATVTATADVIDENNETVILDISAVSNGTESGTQQLTLALADDDAAGVTITQSGGNTLVTEGNDISPDDYSVVLTSEPTSDVTISVTSSNGTTGVKTTTVTDATKQTTRNLTFTSANWSTPQTVTVFATDDRIDEDSVHTATLTHTSSSTDAFYTGLTITPVTVSITDNDAAAVSITETSAGTSVSESGTTDTYDVVLTSQPSADVTIAINVPLNAQDQLATTPTSLTFTSANWDTVQHVNVTALDDLTTEGSGSVTLTHTATSSDTNYNAISIASVVVTVADNDNAAVTLTSSTGTTTLTATEGGSSSTITAVLTSKPTHNVTISFTTNSQIAASPTALTFTATNWNTPQVATISAVNDSVAEGNHTGTVNLAISSTDTFYGALTLNSYTVSITDNDTAGVTLSSSTGSTTLTATEGGSSSTISAVLSSKPTANVVIAASVDANVTLSAPSLTFTATNWNTTQTLTVSATDDSNVENEATYKVSLALTSSDATYSALSALTSYNVTVTDNDKSSVTSSGKTNDDGTGNTISITATRSEGIIFVTRAKENVVRGENTTSTTNSVDTTKNTDTTKTTLSVDNSTITVPVGTDGTKNIAVASEASSTVNEDEILLIGSSEARNGSGMIYIVPRSEVTHDIDLTEIADANTSESALGLAMPDTAPSRGVVIYGHQPGDHLGEYIATGDINGDGVPEYLIAAPGAGLYGIIYVLDENLNEVASIYGSPTQRLSSIILSQLTGSPILDVNFGPNNHALNPELSPVSPLSSTQAVGLITSLEGSSELEGAIDLSQVSSDATLGSGNTYQSMIVADINGDGDNDLIASTMNNEIVIFFGPISSASNISYENANVTITGEGGHFGQALTSADINNDGKVDVICGAPGYESNLGAIYIIYGHYFWKSHLFASEEIETGRIMRITGSAAEGQIGSDFLIQPSANGSYSLYTPEGSSSTLQLALTSTQEIIEIPEVSGRAGLFGCTLIEGDEENGSFPVMAFLMLSLLGLLIFRHGFRQQTLQRLRARAIRRM